jgi:hypothetical protein
MISAPTAKAAIVNREVKRLDMMHLLWLWPTWLAMKVLGPADSLQ